MRDKRKPYWYEIDQKKRGTGNIPKEDVWKREYYIIDIWTRKGRVFSISHYEYVNSKITSVINQGERFQWIGCPTKKFAYDAKQMLQERYGIGISDREQEAKTKKWKDNYGE